MKNRARWLLVFGVLALAVAGCASLPTVRTVQPSFALDGTTDTVLGRGSANTLGELQSPSAIHLLPRGPGAFLARLALAELAERSIDAQYYIWENDRVGKLLLAALARAADRGVRVRVLIDDIGSLPDDETLLLIDSHPNIEVRLFNPASTRSARGFWVFTDFSRVNHRMHNKSFTADNQVTVVGGRNIADEYFQASSEMNYGDLDALAIGAVVPEVSSRFDRFWNSPVVYGIRELHKHRPTPEEAAREREALRVFALGQRDEAYTQAMRDSPVAQELRAGKVSYAPAKITVTSDDVAKVEQPGKDPAANYLMPHLAPEFNRAGDSVVLVSPYFVPGKSGVKWLGDMRKRGLRVRVLTNGLGSTDEPPVFSKYRKYRHSLLASGIELYELNPRSRRDDADGVLQTAGRAGGAEDREAIAALHGKLLVFDCRQFFVGSMNLDPRSARINTEIGLLVDSPDVAGSLCRSLDDTLARGAYRVDLKPGPSGSTRLEWTGQGADGNVTFTQEPHTSAWLRFKAWFFGILPIEGLM